MQEALVIIPTYNERATISAVITEVMALGDAFSVLVVDDGSPDGTADTVRALANSLPARVHLLSRPGKMGLGSAYLEGFRWGLTHDFNHFCEMDGDLSHRPADLARLLEHSKAQGTRMVIGSRYVKGGRIENWPLHRQMISRGAATYARWTTGVPMQDPTSGFVCYHRQVLETLDLSAIRFGGYGFQVEMKFLAWQAGFSWAEVPITFRDRTQGASKLSGTIMREAMLGIPALRLRRTRKSGPHT